MCATDQRGKISVGEYRQVYRLACGRDDTMVLDQRRDTSGVVTDHHVRPGLLLRNTELAIDRERARE